MSLEPNFSKTDCPVCQGKHWDVGDSEHQNLIDAIIETPDVRKKLEIVVLLQDIRQHHVCEKTAARVQNLANGTAIMEDRQQIERSHIRQLEAKEQEILQLKHQYANHDDELRKYYDRIQELEDEAERVEAKHTTQLRNRHKTIQELKTANEDLREQCEQQRKQSKAKYDSTADDVRKWMTDHRQLKRRYDQLHESNQATEEELKTMTQEKASMSQVYTELESLREYKRARLEAPVRKLCCCHCFRSKLDCDGGSNCQNCQTAKTECLYQTCRPFEEHVRWGHGKGCKRAHCTQFHGEDKTGYQFKEGQGKRGDGDRQS